MKTPAFLAVSNTSPARSRVCLSSAMGFCPMPLVLKSAISSIVLLLSSLISAITNLLRLSLKEVNLPGLFMGGHSHPRHDCTAIVWGEQSDCVDIRKEPQLVL